jgi:type III pantothenate kinase
MMWLLIDAGNTRIKWAVFDPNRAGQLGGWLHAGSITHQELAQGAAPWMVHHIERALVANVAGATLQTQLADVLQTQGMGVEWFIAQAALAGVVNRYQAPAQLGCDRFAAAIGAHALIPDQHVIVATCGTATTIDAVSAQGDFIGGMIAPGLQVMAQSLTKNTAQLPHVQNESWLTAHFATHTEGAILSGCLAAQVGAIEHAVARFSALTETASAQPPLCILSGGAAQFIAPSLRTPYRLIDNLVLIGLQASLKIPSSC